MKIEIIYEHGGDCEWEYYDVSNGKPCGLDFDFAIVETNDEGDSTHIGHLCNVHIEPVRVALVKSMGLEIRYV